MPRPDARAVVALTLTAIVAVGVAGCQSPSRVIQVGAPSQTPGASASPIETPPPTSSTQPSGPPSSQPASPPTGSPSSPAAAPGSPSPGGSSSGPAKVTHVIAISLDGLNPDAITRLGESGTPNLHKMIGEGASTLNARTEYEQTRTLPNHAGMLTGRRVDADEGGHGYDVNTDQGSTIERKAGRYVPSVFDVVHDRGGRTALFTAKQKFTVYSRTWNRDGAKDRTGADDGPEKIDRFLVDLDDDALTGQVSADLGRRPAEFTFVHLAGPDEEGHATGFMGGRYLRAVTRTDANVGKILQAVSASPTLRGTTVVIVTADHGGRGAKHDDETSRDNYRIPFLVWGTGVQAGADLYAINPDYRDPGSARVDYAGPQPIRNGDVANLSTGLLGLPAVPGSEFDKAQDLVVRG